MTKTAIESGAIRVLVADSTRMGNQLIVEALRRERGFQVVGTVTAPEELAALAAGAQPHVALIGTGANGTAHKGLEMLRRARSVFPQLHIIMLLDSPSGEIVVEAFRGGARGVVCRDESVGVLVKCVRSVYEGQVWANSEQLRTVLEVLAQESVPRNIVDAQGEALLSRRELDVVRAVAEGMTNREIAFQLQLSEHTIKNYLFRVFDKLGVSNRAELILYALSNRQFEQPAAPRIGASAKSNNGSRGGAKQPPAGDRKDLHLRS